MAKPSPFDWVKSINEKNYMLDLSGYNPFLTNRAFSYHIDTILLAEQMNQHHQLAPDLQYDFYYYAVRQGKRFGFPKKIENEDKVAVVQAYYKYSLQKALEALQILTDDDIRSMISKMDKGGK